MLREPLHTCDARTAIGPSSGPAAAPDVCNDDASPLPDCRNGLESCTDDTTSTDLVSPSFGGCDDIAKSSESIGPTSRFNYTAEPLGSLLEPEEQEDPGPHPSPNDRIDSGNETVNLLCLGVFFTAYFAFRSGCLIVLPFACELLLKPKLGDALYSPLYQLPLTIWFIMDIVLAIPNAFLMQRKGRRVGFVVGATGALVASLAAFCSLRYIAQPWLCFVALNVSVAVMSVIGMAEFVRYAAAEACTDSSRRATVVSRVITCGAITATSGPLSSSLAIHITKGETFQYEYATCFLFLAIFAALALGAALALKLPPTTKVQSHAVPIVPLLQIMRRPGVCGAIFSQVVVQFVMVTLMSGSPLAMEKLLNLEHSPGNYHISTCIMSHVLGMFLPGFVTGKLIKKIGTLPMMCGGVFLQAISQAVLLCGTQAVNFFIGLVLLGVGWNCAFIAGTVLLLENHAEEERTRVTSANETLRFLANAAGVLLSSTLPWEILNGMCFAFLLLLVPAMLLVPASVRWP